MVLTLEVTGSQAATLGAESRQVFSTEGGVIGRAKTSDWVLSHAKVSSRHAVISYGDGVFYIEDTSTNGVFINSPGNRLVRGRRYALQSGDRILIDPYEIEVSVSRTQEAHVPRRHDPYRREAGVLDAGGAIPGPFAIEDPFAPEPAAQQRPTPRPTPPPGRSTPEPVPVEEVDPLKLLGGDVKPPPARIAPTAEELDRRSFVADHFEPPAVVPARVTQPPEPFIIPADYDPLRDDFVDRPPTVTLPPAPVATAPVEPSDRVPVVELPRVTPPPEEERGVPEPGPEPPREEFSPAADQSKPSRESTTGLDAVLSGAGLERIESTPELARGIGEIFRVVVAGVMDVLRSRQQVKDEFRMRMTQFRPADNNPLKFSANVEDALHNLLVKRNPAYLGPVEAFEDAFDDLRNHQLAVLAGLRVAFDSMLAEFDPNRLEKQFDRQVKRIPLLRLIARLRYWDLYRDLRDEIDKDPDASFKRLFGEHFARAYEEQLNRLKAEGRAGARAGREDPPGRR